MSCCGGGSDPSAYARQLETQKQAKIQTGLGDINSIFSGFDENFYNKRKDDYVRYALPQFGRQFQDANKNLAYSLAGHGLTNSSAARTSFSNLGFQGDVQKQGIVDTAAQQGNELRKGVEGQRSNLIGQLQLSADPTSSAQQALASAQGFQAPSTFQPLNNLFANYAKTYALGQQSQAVNQFTSGLNSNSPLGSQPYSLSK